MSYIYHVEQMCVMQFDKYTGTKIDKPLHNLFVDNASLCHEWVHHWPDIELSVTIIQWNQLYIDC